MPSVFSLNITQHDPVSFYFFVSVPDSHWSWSCVWYYWRLNNSLNYLISLDSGCVMLQTGWEHLMLFFTNLEKKRDVFLEIRFQNEFRLIDLNGGVLFRIVEFWQKVCPGKHLSSIQTHSVLKPWHLVFESNMCVAVDFPLQFRCGQYIADWLLVTGCLGTQFV